MFIVMVCNGAMQSSGASCRLFEDFVTPLIRWPIPQIDLARRYQ